MKTAQYIVGYFPVVQQGYLDLLKTYPRATIGVLDTEILQQFEHLRKDIRALQPEIVVRLLKPLHPQVVLADKKLLNSIDLPGTEIILPEDELTGSLKARFKKAKVTTYPVFLRWNRSNTTVNQAVRPHRTIKAKAFGLPLIEAIYTAADKSSNPWRRVGAILLRGGELIDVDHNQHQPTGFTPAIDGEPRMNLGRGSGIELSTDEHAEARLIARAARTGTKLKGVELALDTFPCPVCAKMVAGSGIKTCYFIEGYAMIDGQQILEDAGIEIVQIIDVPPRRANSKGERLYPEKAS